MCPKHSICVNKPGSFQCDCIHGYKAVMTSPMTLLLSNKSGFQLNSMSADSCIDIDECSDTQHSCDQNAACTNTEGMYHCNCNEPFWKGQGSADSRSDQNGSNHLYKEYEESIITWIIRESLLSVEPQAR